MNNIDLLEQGTYTYRTYKDIAPNFWGRIILNLNSIQAYPNRKAGKKYNLNLNSIGYYNAT